MAGSLPFRALAFGLLAGIGLTGAGPVTEVTLTAENLRNERGELHICVTRNRDHFPDCAGDPAALKVSQPATQRAARISVAPGNYAVSLIHDENGNGKLDTLLGIPREGFAFSRNPGIGFGPPDYEDVLITVGDERSVYTLRVRYLL